MADRRGVLRTELFYFIAIETIHLGQTECHSPAKKKELLAEGAKYQDPHSLRFESVFILKKNYFVLNYGANVK